MRSQYCHCPPALPFLVPAMCLASACFLGSEAIQGQNMQHFKVLQRPLCV
ncbi:hypothetical protein AB395_00005862 (plasmid) [Sinorhizobium fredii CCBAU 45436]|nr:hypothetical protein AB395_00005862 [Sinorhizobium fredii CCBAU 45436]